MITLVNGVDPRGKSIPELQPLFSSQRPEQMTLQIDRAGKTKTLSFSLAEASDVLHRNHRELHKGKIIPAGMPPEYPNCED